MPVERGLFLGPENQKILGNTGQREQGTRTPLVFHLLTDGQRRVLTANMSTSSPGELQRPTDSAGAVLQSWLNMVISEKRIAGASSQGWASCRDEERKTHVQEKKKKAVALTRDSINM